MKQFLVLLLLLFVTSICFSQDLKKDLKPFKSITITSAMEVELIIADKFAIEITGNDIDKLTISNADLLLKLATTIGKKFKSDLKVKIYYKPGLRYIKLANQVSFNSTDIIKEKFLDFEATNNVKAVLKLYIDDFAATLSLGSNLLVEGVTKSQKITASSKSFYDAFNFKSKKAFVEVKAAQAGIYVSEFLDANAKLKGVITYMGDPYSVNEKTFLGKVIHKSN